MLQCGNYAQDQRKDILLIKPQGMLLTKQVTSFQCLQQIKSLSGVELRTGSLGQEAYSM